MLASNPVKTDPAFNSVIAAFCGWLRNRKLIRQCRQRLAACDKNEIAHIARDVGLSSHDLREMAQLGPDAAKQLLNRMAVLHLDADALAKSEPTTMPICSDCVRVASARSDASATSCSFPTIQCGGITARMPARSTHCRVRPRTLADMRGRP